MQVTGRHACKRIPTTHARTYKRVQIDKLAINEAERTLVGGSKYKSQQAEAICPTRCLNRQFKKMDIRNLAGSGAGASNSTSN